jgi:hypothetical protein
MEGQGGGEAQGVADPKKKRITITCNGLRVLQWVHSFYIIDHSKRLRRNREPLRRSGRVHAEKINENQKIPTSFPCTGKNA